MENYKFLGLDSKEPDSKICLNENGNLSFGKYKLPCFDITLICPV